MKKLTLTCSSALDEEREKLQQTDPEFADLMVDQFLLEYQKQRMLEMMAKAEKLNFGTVIELNSSEEFLKAIDDEDKSVTIIIHIYQNDISACNAMNGCLITLAQDYPSVKFCKILGGYKISIEMHKM